MTTRGGDISQMMIGGREFDVVAEANVTYRLGGWTNESTPTGNGGVHNKKSRKLAGFDSLPLSVDGSRQDLEYLQDLANSGEPTPFAMTLANAKVYAGDLTIQGEVDANTGDGQVEISALGQRFEQL